MISYCSLFPFPWSCSDQGYSQNFCLTWPSSGKTLTCLSFYPNSYASHTEAMLFTVVVRKIPSHLCQRHKFIQILAHCHQRQEDKKEIFLLQIALQIGFRWFTANCLNFQELILFVCNPHRSHRVVAELNLCPCICIHCPSHCFILSSPLP